MSLCLRWQRHTSYRGKAKTQPSRTTAFGKAEKRGQAGNLSRLEKQSVRKGSVNSGKDMLYLTGQH